MVKSTALRYHSYGNPSKVLQLDQVEVDTNLTGTEVLVQWLLSPINPLDINRIEGTYAIKMPVPAIGGSEGVGVVRKVGPNVTKVKPGQKVVHQGGAVQVWSQLDVVDEDSLLPVNPKLDLVSASTLVINPPTAYIMLKEFVKLDAGDYVIQNSANSAVGRCVIQEAKAFGYKTINVVRSRPDIELLKSELKKLGANYVFTEEEFKKNGRTFCANLDRPIKLACNGVGGRSALAISAVLARSATCVTYGGMSKKPAEFSTGAIVFNDLRAFGVAVTNFVSNPKNKEKVEVMYKELQDLILKGKLLPPPHQINALQDFKGAFDKHFEGKSGKQFLEISKESNVSKL